MKRSLLILIASLVGCSSALPTNDYLITRLRNRGPIPVSIDNPYLASNSLLDKEKEKSAELRGFLEKRGAPSAIEIEKDTFSSPQLKMFYQDKTEYYTLEEAGETWLISGPYPISGEKLSQISPLLQHSAKFSPPKPPAQVQLQPTLRAPSASIAAPSTAAPQAQLRVSAPPPLNPPSRPVYSSTASSERAALEKLVSRYGNTQAEVSPRGDIVHYVVNEGESLRLIARWYTLDADNAAQIASANKIDDPNKLLLGDSIIVPARLVRNKKFLSDEAFTVLKTIVEKR